MQRAVEVLEMIIQVCKMVRRIQVTAVMVVEILQLAKTEEAV
jgi:hypothetical protein